MGPCRNSIVTHCTCLTLGLCSGFYKWKISFKEIKATSNLQCVTIEFRQGSIYVVNSHFSRPPNRHKSSNSTKPFRPIFTISESFQMRYCMTLYLKGHQKYNRSKLKIQLLSSKSRLFKFDLLYFWYHLRYRVIHYLIWKLSDMVKMG